MGGVAAIRQAVSAAESIDGNPVIGDAGVAVIGDAVLGVLGDAGVAVMADAGVAVMMLC